MKKVSDTVRRRPSLQLDVERTFSTLEWVIIFVVLGCFNARLVHWLNVLGLLFVFLLKSFLDSLSLKYDLV